MVLGHRAWRRRCRRRACGGGDRACPSCLPQAGNTGIHRTRSSPEDGKRLYDDGKASACWCCGGGRLVHVLPGGERSRRCHPVPQSRTRARLPSPLHQNLHIITGCKAVLKFGGKPSQGRQPDTKGPRDFCLEWVVQLDRMSHDAGSSGASSREQQGPRVPWGQRSGRQSCDASRRPPAQLSLPARACHKSTCQCHGMR
jgi:hypothetical protein